MRPVLGDPAGPTRPSPWSIGIGARSVSHEAFLASDGINITLCPEGNWAEAFPSLSVQQVILDQSERFPSSSMSSEEPSYIIVGAGVFGVSTAYHLIQKYPHASVTLVDRDAYDAESRVAASWDWNKVVRADYDDIVYCQLALEAQDIFKSDPLWKPYFHETGIYWMCRSDYAQDVIDNYKKLGRTADLAAVPIDEARKLYGGLFEDADYTGVKEVLVNKSSGWAAAGDALRAVTREALDLGVKYHIGEVAGLHLDSEGRCFGIKTAKGNVLTASHTVLCTGAYTPKLLEYSAASSGVLELRAGSRIVAGGITTGMTKLDDESYKRFASMPVGVQGYTAKTGDLNLHLLLFPEANRDPRPIHWQPSTNS